MDIKYLLIGIIFFVIGLLMFLNVRKRKPASDETNWQGQLLPNYIKFWITAFMAIIVGIIFILKSL